MVVILNAPIQASKLLQELTAGAGQYGIPLGAVLDFDASTSAAEIRRNIPGNVVVTGLCTAQQIAGLRLALGALDSYIYAYRPASGSQMAAMGDDDAQQVYDQLEQASRDADVGLPLPAESYSHFIANVFSDINDTGELAEAAEDFIARFEAAAKALRAALPAADVHHIGSTALGIRAKPIIDILVAVPESVSFLSVVPALHGLGFYWVDYPGNTSRWYFRLGFPRKMHVHLVRQGSEEERTHLLFRDRLLASEHLRREYEQLKVGLSNRFAHDRAEYGRAKSVFIESVLA